MKKLRRKTQDPKRHFDKARAKNYDRRIHQVIPGYATVHELARVAVGELVGGKGRVLIVGAGTGRETVDIAKAYPGLRLVGVDPSPAMIAKARGNVARAGLGRRVKLFEGLVGDLDDGGFDAATLILVMHFVADDGSKLELLRAVGKRLKRGRPLILTDMFGDREDKGFRRLMDVWQRFQAERGVERKEIKKGKVYIRKDIHLIAERRLARLLHAAGFGAPEPFFRALVFGGWIAFKR